MVVSNFFCLSVGYLPVILTGTSLLLVCQFRY